MEAAMGARLIRRIVTVPRAAKWLAESIVLVYNIVLLYMKVVGRTDSAETPNGDPDE